MIKADLVASLADSMHLTIRDAAAVILFLFLYGCSAHLDCYNAGAGLLCIGDRIDVEQECTKHGLSVSATDERVFGCTDFDRREMYATPDSAVIAHEVCRLRLMAGTGDERCPTPVLP